MDLHKIKQIMELLEKTDISELEITEGEDAVRILRHFSSPAPSCSSLMQQPTFSVVATPPAPAPVLAGSVAEFIVTAPMVGTFYRAASPQAPAFVDIGMNVKVGHPLCIIEAMKMMNTIEAEKSGVIKAILVENGQAVEFGQPLMVVAL
jgi:acetyl-CoA carboxylase biotin carboxyl carrier protein